MNANLGSTKEPPWQRSLDNHCPGWTKLRIFGLQQYETILYIDSDCLVLHDVTSLIALNKVYTESEALIAAAPDILPPHHFNSGVMVIRPSTKVMTSLKRQAPILNTQDRSDTGILNAYFNTWNTEFPPMARLSTGYNAQQAMHDMTSDATGNSSFWDTQVACDLHIVHYSNPIKPWQTVENEAPQSSSLHKLWKTWYTKSQNMLMRHRKENAQRMREQASAKGRPTFGAGPTPPRPPPAASQQDPRQLHKLISKRFKELKRQGKSAKDAMQQANDEFGQGGGQRQFNPGTAVAAMFGMTL
jgi:glycogenin glucosyltransferase